MTMTRKEEAADCRELAKRCGKLFNVQDNYVWLQIRNRYLALAEALEMECEVRDVVVGDRRAA